MNRVKPLLWTMVFCATVLASSASAVLAAADSPSAGAGGGINLSWDDCGKAGQSNRNFACDPDSAVPPLVASFVAPGGIAGYLGFTAWLTVSTRSALPDWWKHGRDLCRGRTGLSTSFDFTSMSKCDDFFGGVAYGGHESWVGVGGANRARIAVQCAVPLDSRGPLAEGKEYYAFSVRIASPVAGDSCQGCRVPACITFDSIQLFQPPEARFDPVLSTPATRSHVTWQGGPDVCPGTPAISRNWGRIGTIHR